MSETTSARRIEARFRFRRMGKVWRYSDRIRSKDTINRPDPYPPRDREH